MKKTGMSLEEKAYKEISNQKKLIEIPSLKGFYVQVRQQSSQTLSPIERIKDSELERSVSSIKEKDTTKETDTIKASAKIKLDSLSPEKDKKEHCDEINSKYTHSSFLNWNSYPVINKFPQENSDFANPEKYIDKINLEYTGWRRFNQDGEPDAVILMKKNSRYSLDYEALDKDFWKPLENPQDYINVIAGKNSTRVDDLHQIHVINPCNKEDELLGAVGTAFSILNVNGFINSGKLHLKFPRVGPDLSLGGGDSGGSGGGNSGGGASGGGGQGGGGGNSGGSR
jgi:uncharacterized membrane protein YgcG